MTLVIPFLALALAGGFVAYHRKGLWLWTLLSAIALVICWFTGVNQTAVIVAAAIVAVISAIVLLPFLRKPLITTPLMKFFRKVCKVDKE